MCTSCRSSLLGLERQANVEAARKALRLVGLVPSPLGVLLSPQVVHTQCRTPQQHALLDEYLDACAALRRLHTDYTR